MERAKSLDKQAVREWLLARQQSRQPLPEWAQMLHELQRLAAEGQGDTPNVKAQRAALCGG